MGRHHHCQCLSSKSRKADIRGERQHLWRWCRLLSRCERGSCCFLTAMTEIPLYSRAGFQTAQLSHSWFPAMSPPSLPTVRALNLKWASECPICNLSPDGLQKDALSFAVSIIAYIFQGTRNRSLKFSMASRYSTGIRSLTAALVILCSAHLPASVPTVILGNPAFTKGASP